MGMLTRFDLPKIKRKANVHHMIETGTWYGEAVQHALTAGMTVESCEINGKLYMIADDRFRHRREAVTLYQLPSYKFLPLAQDVPALYWLDAHLPELYIHHEAGVYFDKSLSVPLEHELNILKAKRHFDRSVFIVDDVRIYHDEFRYEGGNIEKIDDFDLIGWFRQNAPAHDVYFSNQDQGYIIATPKKANVFDSDIFMSCIPGKL